MSWPGVEAQQAQEQLAARIASPLKLAPDPDCTWCGYGPGDHLWYVIDELA